MGLPETPRRCSASSPRSITTATPWAGSRKLDMNCDGRAGAASVRVREDEARADVKNSEERLVATRTEWEESSARFEALRCAVGARVEDLKRQLAEAVEAVKMGEGALARARSTLSAAGEARAVARERAASASDAVRQRGEERALAVVRWQQFVATGLLAATIPGNRAAGHECVVDHRSRAYAGAARRAGSVGSQRRR